MPFTVSATFRRALRLAGYVLLTLLVYWVNNATPPDARLGILYTIPVLLITWTEGLAWGIVFGVASLTLREAVAWDQMPAHTPLTWRIMNQRRTSPSWHWRWPDCRSCAAARQRSRDWSRKTR
jgi:hypothetical protein